MRISDWSSDVCSSDLVEGAETLARQIQRIAGPGRKLADRRHVEFQRALQAQRVGIARRAVEGEGHRRRFDLHGDVGRLAGHEQIGKASWRERGWPYV